VKAIVNVFLKDGVLDPQGKATHHALLLANTVIEDYKIEIVE